MRHNANKRITSRQETTISKIDIQAVDRVGRILALFGPARESITSAEAAELIGLNRTTTYRYLASLVAADVLEVRKDRTYAPGPTLMQLGAFALGRQDVVELARAPMAALAQDTTITTVLSLWGASAPVVAHVEESPQRQIVVTVRVGMQLTEQAAQWRVFQAFRGDDPRIRRTVRALEDEERERLDDETVTTREQGFSGQVSPRGIAVLAVPIFDESEMVATLALLSTRDALDVSADSPELVRLRETAATISHAMGSTTIQPTRA